MGTISPDLMPTELKIDWTLARRLGSFRVWTGRGKPEVIDESVHFHHRDFPELGQLASAVGYDVFHGAAGPVRVYILEHDAEVFQKAGADGALIVAEVRRGVRRFFRDLRVGRTPMRGKIVGVVNA